ncbi:MAG: hypothetical protein PHE15_07370 [Dehalococcoidales bacterium]|nr:hypothetical protein [Dehalococcoidales bacterium]
MNPSDHDIRSNRFIFVPFCMLAQAIRAVGIVKHFPAVVNPIIDVLMDQNINIIQMPCPELFFDTFNRTPCRKAKYDTPENRRVYREASRDVLKQIINLRKAGHKVDAILGIEYSPSCAISRLTGTSQMNDIKESGIFIEEIKRLLNENKLLIPFVGIEIYHIDRSIDRLKSFLSQNRLH